jgi:heme-degrading monooxygenase HmoA
VIRLAIDFAVESDQQARFEDMYRDVYLVALGKQAGFEGSSLLRLYSADVLTEIGAEIPIYNYRMTLDFESEAARRAWVGSREHDPAWKSATALATKYTYTGYDVVAQSPAQ